jgi:hypothetical protein
MGDVRRWPGLRGCAVAVACAVAVLTPRLAPGEDGSAADRFTEAMSHEDYVEKKHAIEELAAAPDDATVLPLLVSAVADRQAHDVAVQALRRRTGLRPAPNEGGSPGFPGYPVDDSAAGWSAWLDGWRHQRALAAELEANRRLAEHNRKLLEQGRKEPAHAGTVSTPHPEPDRDAAGTR